MTEQKPKGQEQQNKDITMLIVLSAVWILFLVGILGYFPYHKEAPQPMKDKVEKQEEIYERKPNGVNQ